MLDKLREMIDWVSNGKRKIYSGRRKGEFLMTRVDPQIGKVLLLVLCPSRCVPLYPSSLLYPVPLCPLPLGVVLTDSSWVACLLSFSGRGRVIYPSARERNVSHPYASDFPRNLCHRLPTKTYSRELSLISDLHFSYLLAKKSPPVHLVRHYIKHTFFSVKDLDQNHGWTPKAYWLEGSRALIYYLSTAAHSTRC